MCTHRLTAFAYCNRRKTGRRDKVPCCACDGLTHASTGRLTVLDEEPPAPEPPAAAASSDRKPCSSSRNARRRQPTATWGGKGS